MTKVMVKNGTERHRSTKVFNYATLKYEECEKPFRCCADTGALCLCLVKWWVQDGGDHWRRLPVGSFYIAASTGRTLRPNLRKKSAVRMIWAELSMSLQDCTLHSWTGSHWHGETVRAPAWRAHSAAWWMSKDLATEASKIRPQWVTVSQYPFLLPPPTPHTQTVIAIRTTQLILCHYSFLLTAYLDDSALWHQFNHPHCIKSNYKSPNRILFFNKIKVLIKKCF